MCASRPARLIGPTVRSCLASVEHFAIRHPLRMRIEHWELSIGQIPGRIQGGLMISQCKHSRANQIYKPSSGTGESLEVAGIGCHDRISVRREQNESGIDDVALLGSCEKLASAFAEVFAQRPHIDAGERLCQKS